MICQHQFRARFLSLARSNLRLCLANHRAGYFSNLACDWLSIVWAYSEQETENGPRSCLGAVERQAIIWTTIEPWGHMTTLGRHELISIQNFTTKTKIFPVLVWGSFFQEIVPIFIGISRLIIRLLVAESDVHLQTVFLGYFGLMKIKFCCNTLI